MLLGNAGQISGSIGKGDQRNVESITEANKSAGFIGSIDVQAACHDFWLVSNDADTAAVQATERGDDIAGITGLYFKEIMIIHDRGDDIAHIVRAVRTIRNNITQSL